MLRKAACYDGVCVLMHLCLGDGRSETETQRQRQRQRERERERERELSECRPGSKLKG